MSKYTTEVRYICEVASGLTDSLGFYDVDDILEKSWDKIFTTKAEIFDEEYRPFLCKKILKHFYTREIGAETVGLWKLWLNTRFAEILPYYNQLYLTEKLKFDPFIDTDYTTISEGITANEKNATNNLIKTGQDKTSTEATTKDIETNATTSQSETSNNRKDKYSDTPQGSLTDVENGKYLTNYRNTSDTDTSRGKTQNDVTKNMTNNSVTTNNVSENQENTNNETNNGTSNNVTTVKGKRGSESYMKLLQEYRESLLNIDVQVINDFEDLFFGLW